MNERMRMNQQVARIKEIRSLGGSEVVRSSSK